MLMQILVYLFFGSFVAALVMGHVLLAQALSRPSAGVDGLRAVTDNTHGGARNDRSGARSLSTMTLEATQSY